MSHSDPHRSRYFFSFLMPEYFQSIYLYGFSSISYFAFPIVLRALLLRATPGSGRPVPAKPPTASGVPLSTRSVPVFFFSRVSIRVVYDSQSLRAIYFQCRRCHLLQRISFHIITIAPNLAILPRSFGLPSGMQAPTRGGQPGRDQ